MKYNRKQLEQLNIHSLRIVARDIGVKAPTSLTKNVLIEEILLIQSGKKQPYIRTNKGRPVKDNILESISIKGLNPRQKKIKKELIDVILKEVEKQLYKFL